MRSKNAEFRIDVAHIILHSQFLILNSQFNLPVSIRTERVAATIRQALAEHLTRSTQEYLDGMVTITAVRISADLSVARVYVSIWNSKTKPEILVKRMNANQGEFRSVLARALRLRKVPELRFFRDDTLDEAEHIEDLIRKVREEDDRMARARGELPPESDPEIDSQSDPEDRPGESPDDESNDD